MRKILITAAAAAAVLVGTSATSAAAMESSADPVSDPTGFARQFGPNNFDKQYGLVNTAGAPLVYADLGCALPWSGGAAQATIGAQYQACNFHPQQMKTGGVIS